MNSVLLLICVALKTKWFDKSLIGVMLRESSNKTAGKLAFQHCTRNGNLFTL